MNVQSPGVSGETKAEQCSVSLPCGTPELTSLGSLSAEGHGTECPNILNDHGLSLVVRTAHSFLSLSFPQLSIEEMLIITKQLQMYYSEINSFHESQ